MYGNILVFLGLILLTSSVASLRCFEGDEQHAKIVEDPTWKHCFLSIIDFNKSMFYYSGTDVEHNSLKTNCLREVGLGGNLQTIVCYCSRPACNVPGRIFKMMDLPMNSV